MVILHAKPEAANGFSAIFPYSGGPDPMAPDVLKEKTPPNGGPK